MYFLLCFAQELATLRMAQRKSYKVCLLTALYLGGWLLAGPATAQPTSPIWQKVLGGSSQDGVRPVISNPDGSVVVAGSTNSNDGDVTTNKGESDLWVVKLDRLGQLIWQKTYGGRFNEGASDIKATADGGYVAVGTTSSNDGDVTGKKGSSDWWVIRLDGQGNLLWQKTFGGSSFENANAVVTTPDGGFIVAGYTTSNDGDVTGHKFSFDCWVIKLDSQGNLLWQKVFGGTGLESASAIEVTPDGGCVVAGYTSSQDGDVVGNNGETDWWVFKLDKNGNMLWQKPLGGKERDFFYSLTITSDGKIVLAGTQSVYDPNTQVYTEQSQLIKLDNQGNVLWTKLLNTISNKLFVITATPDSGVVLVSNHTPLTYQVAKINAQGNLLWQTTLDGAITYEVYGAAITSDGDLLVAGIAKENLAGSQQDAWVAKLSLASPLPQLSVYHLDDGGNKPINSNNRLRPYLQIANQGLAPVPYSELTVRYWLTVDDFAPLTNLQVYYAPFGADKVRMKYVPLDQPRQNAFGYVEYSFDASAAALAPGTRSGPIENGIGKADWTPMDEANDYSYAPNTSYTQNRQITLYRNGTLVWGVEPPLVTPKRQLKVYSINPGEPVANSINVRLLVENEGNIPINYNDLRVRYYFTADDSRPLSFTVVNSALGEQHIKGYFVRLNPPAQKADTYREITFFQLDKLYPLSGTGLIQFRITKPGSFTQTNDYSYAPGQEWVENPRIVLYLNGGRVWGTDPPKAGGRLAAPDLEIPLEVVVLGNPVVGSDVAVEVRGAEGQPLNLQLTDLQGRLVSEQQLTEAGPIEQSRLKLGTQPPGLLLLRVQTPGQAKTLKLIKAD